MFQSDHRKIASNSSTTTRIIQNPFAQRANPSTDIKTYMIKAQNATDVKLKFEIYDEIIKDMPVNLELSRFFAELLAEIFGLGDYPGWRLHSLDHKSHNDEILFKKVHGFMSPNGSLFKLIDKLEHENATFEFPSTLLPKNIQDQLQRSNSSFVGAKGAGIVPGSHVTMSQNLSALEYYLFLFFSYILQPKIQKESIDWDGDVLYTSLFEVYLTYFLPLNSSKKPDAPHQETSSNSFFSRQDKSRVSPTDGGLFAKITSFNDKNIYSSDAGSLIATNRLRNLRPVTWKSEKFMQVLRDLWLAYEPIQAQEYYLPGTDQVLMIRIFVKHLHHFLNEETLATGSTMSPHSSITSINHEDELKRTIMPMVQRKLYHFLKNCFLHWPLDASFKMVLETWLSYIQPWRYQNKTDSLTNLDDWSEFIEENLVFYTVLFRMFMQRATRLDLQFLKDVQFIFRVTKVFSQFNLPQLLQEAENSILMASSHSSIHPLSRSRLGSSTYTAFRTSPKAIDLVDNGYESLFAQHYVLQMQELANVIFTKAETVRKETARQQMARKSDHSLVGRIRAFFAYTSDDDYDSDEAMLEKKLDAVCNQLAGIFNFEPPVSTEPNIEQTYLADRGHLPKPFISDKCYDDGRLLPEHVIESDGSVTLTDKGRLQILYKLRHFDIQGKTSTELEPVKSYEIPSLVRLLHKLSTGLNEKYKDPLSKLYNRNDIFGKVLRCLSPKVVQYRGIPVKLPQSIAVGAVEPRVCLRFLASYYTLYYICWLIILFKLFGLGVLEFLLILLFLLVLFTLQNVVSTPVQFSPKND